jgi:peptide-methionine (S)-S-oxide reductase
MSKLLKNIPLSSKYQLCTVAAGCFWGLEKFFKNEFKDGIISEAVGYSGGSIPNPTYKQVCTGKTGHAECFRFEFDPNLVSYRDLLNFMFRM